MLETYGGDETIDPDSVDTTVTFKLEGAGDDEESFDLENGVLTADTALRANFEDQSSYSLVVIASAGEAARAMHTRLGVTVKVLDREDGGSVDLSAREPQVGRPVHATLSDPDGGVNRVSWTWYRGGTLTLDPDGGAVPTTIDDCEPETLFD